MNAQAPTRASVSVSGQMQTAGRRCVVAKSFSPSFSLHRRSAVFSAEREPVLSAARLAHLPASSSRCCPTVCSLDSISHPGEERQDQRDFPTNISIPVTGMAKGLGSFKGGATLERQKLDQRQTVRETSNPKLDNHGGGGNIGKGNVNGGGGDNDDGDDDDYFQEGDDGDGDSENFFRRVMEELYDKESIRAVLQEWFQNFSSLPEMIRQSVEMGLFSSAALTRFFAMDVRPNVTRAVTRCLSPSVSREIVGRLMADPAFAQKMVIEQLITITGSLIWESRQRGDRFLKELDLVAINTLSLAASQAALVWLISPTRSFGTVRKMPWQQLLSDLPNHAFETSTKFHQFSVNQRLVSVFTKAAELAAVGTMAGAAMCGLSNAAVAVRRTQDPSFTPSVPIPGLQQSVGGMAVTMALVGNARYQTICGVDRWLFDHSSQLWSYLTMSAVCRLAGYGYISEPARLSLLGLPIDASQPPAAAPAAAAAPAPRPRVTRQGPKKPRRKVARGFEMSLVGASQ